MTRNPTQPTRVKRDDRLDFRLDDQTKALIERAAQLERRKVSEVCVTALTTAAREAVARHEQIQLAEAEREAFFDVLLHPPKANERLKRAMALARHRIVT